ncbi:MAG: hypothetical protein JRI68_22875 [Deltaproteobacteria bacterium]|nr:hypothetical protein [Deltaproteobacteria bacterium]
MCGGYRFYVSLLEGVKDLEPRSLAVVGGAAIGLVGTALLLRATVRRGRAVNELAASIEPNGPAPSEVPSLRLHGPVGVALALLVPVVAAVAVLSQRNEFARCFEAYLQHAELPGCTGTSWWVDGAVDQIELLGLAGLLWLPLLPLSAVTLGLSIACGARAGRLRKLLALDEAALVEEHGRYRVDAQRGHHAARDWLLMNRGPSTARYVIVALASALLGPGLLAAGVVHQIFRLEEAVHVARLAGPTGSTAHSRFDLAIANTYDLLGGYSAAALLGLAIAVVLALVLLAPASPPRAARPALARCSSGASSPAARLRTVGPVIAGVLCLLLALPAAIGNAHPAPAFAKPFRSDGLVDRTKLQVPQLQGPDSVVDAPHVTIGYGAGLKVLLDGNWVGQVGGEADELEELALRKKELWSSFHPNRAYPGVVLVSADRRLTAAQLAPFLSALRRTGHTTLLLHLSQEQKLDPPPLGVWTTASSHSAVRVSLAWHKDLPTLERAHRERLARGQASEGYQVIHPSADLGFDALAAVAVVARHGGGRAVIAL